MKCTLAAALRPAHLESKHASCNARPGVRTVLINFRPTLLEILLELVAFHQGLSLRR